MEFYKDVPVAQTVEHLPFKERVVGSSPTGYIQLRSHFRLLLTKNLTARFQEVQILVFEAVKHLVNYTTKNGKYC